MKLTYFGGCLVILAILLTGLGCSDDDCATCPGATVQQGTMQGGILFDNSKLVLAGNILNLDGALTVDSVLVEGNVAELNQFDDALGNVIFVRYEVPRNETQLSSGDQLDIKIYMPNGVCSSSPKILDRVVDTPTIIDWMMTYPYDTVAVDTDITINWNSVPNADWYTFSARYWYDSLGTYAYGDERDYYQPDTTFTIPGSETQYNGYYTIAVRAWTGPYPDSGKGNIDGGIIKGAISSITYRSFYVYVGTGEPRPDSDSDHNAKISVPPALREFVGDFEGSRR